MQSLQPILESGVGQRRRSTDPRLPRITDQASLNSSRLHGGEAVGKADWFVSEVPGSFAPRTREPPMGNKRSLFQRITALAFT
jgi:hypothetical protein